MKRIIEEPLVFPIGEKDYTVKPVGIDDGYRLADILNGDEKASKGVTNADLFRLAMGNTYDEMREDGVALHLAFRAGMASLAHFRTLTAGSTFEDATAAAEAIWESGLDPKALEEWAAKNLKPQTPEPRSAAGGASTANTSGTSTRKATTRSAASKKASPSSTLSSSGTSSSATSKTSTASRSTTRRAR